MPCPATAAIPARAQADGVHVALDHHQRGGALLDLGQLQQTPRLGHAVERAALVEERRLRPVQVFGARVGIEGAAAEADHAAPPVGDGEHHAVAEAVVGRAAVLRRDQEARVDEVARPSPLGDEVVLQRRAAGGRVAQAETHLVLRAEPSPVEVGARGLARRAAQLGGVPARRFVQPLPQTHAPRLGGRLVRVVGRQRQPRLARQPLHRLAEGEALVLLQEGDQVAVLAG